MKKIFFFAITCSLSQSVFANTIYGGFLAGADFFSVKKSVSAVDFHPTVVLPTPTLLSNTRAGGNGGTGGIFLGYSWRFPISDLGLEVFVNGSSSKVRQSIFNTNLGQGFNVSEQEELKGYYGFAVKPGYFVNEKAKIYAKIGYVNGRFSVKTNNVSFSGRNSPNRLGGWLAGGGAEVFVNPNFSLNIEYNHIQYRRQTYQSRLTEPFLNTINLTGVPIATSPQLRTTEYHPQSNNVLFGFTYYFRGFMPGMEIRGIRDEGDYDV